MSLGLLAAMLYGIQKLGIGSGKTRQLLGVELVGLTLVAVDQPCLARIGHQNLVTAVMEDPVHPGRVGTDFDGDLHLLPRVEAATEVVWGSTQPALLEELTTVGVEDAQIAVLVAEVQTHRHLRLLGATITHGSILLSGPLQEPVDYLQPLPKGTARGLALLISSRVVHGAGGEGDRLLGGVLRRGDHRKAASPRRLDTLPLGGATIPTTMTY